jgi:hypothetical protein
MKDCPVCKRTYDDTLVFCLEDGKRLIAKTDPEATLVRHKASNPLISAKLLKKYSRLMEAESYNRPRLFSSEITGIPKDKLTTAYTTYAHAALLADENPVLLYDNSLLRNGTTGCLITERGVYYKNGWSRAGHIALRYIESVEVFHVGLQINGSIQINLERGRKKNIQLICLMLLESIKSPID